MKIFIDGSTRSAVNRMFPIWEKLGHKIVSNWEEADIQLSVVKIKVKGNIPIVLRLDGIYYDKADNYQRRNSEISKSHKNANAVIYQSNFSKKMCEKYLMKRTGKIYDVIHNGIEQWPRVEKHKGINIVSCAKWRRPKRLPELISIFRRFRIFYPSSKLHIIGPIGKGSTKIFDTNVIYYDRLSEKSIKDVYKVSDIYIHLCKKDSCPSTVVEAISSGIPVITTNACGGATEMSKFTNGCVIINEKDNLEPDFIYQNKYNEIEKEVEDEIINSMIQIIKEKPLINLPKKLTIDYVANKYLKIMKKCLEKK